MGDNRRSVGIWLVESGLMLCCVGLCSMKVGVEVNQQGLPRFVAEDRFVFFTNIYVVTCQHVGWWLMKTGIFFIPDEGGNH